MSYNFDLIWNNCLSFNIEQKPDEYKSLLDLLYNKSNRKIALEIGSNYGGFAAGLCEIFDQVISIDIKHHPNFDSLKQKYSNYNYIIADSTKNDTLNYLKSLNIKFDFIFIDGDHSYDGVKSDYFKFKQLLHSEGFLAFHDIVSSQENESNNIYVSKFWSEIKSDYKESYEFISEVDTKQYSTDNMFHSIMKNQRYNSWGGIGVIKNFAVSLFSHNYLANDWYSIIDNQFQKITNSKLYKRADNFFCGVYSSSDEDYYSFLNLVKKYDDDLKISVVRYDSNKFEYNTLINLQNYCKLNPNGLVFYYHSKGTSKLIQDQSVKSWRDCLEYGNMEHWKRSFDLLKSEEFDIAGILYILDCNTGVKIYKNYYSGNFWWADCKYINTLPNLSLTYVDTLKSGDIVDHRTACELWLGKAYHRWANYYTPAVNGWREVVFDPNSYKVFG